MARFISIFMQVVSLSRTQARGGARVPWGILALVIFLAMAPVQAAAATPSGTGGGAGNPNGAVMEPAAVQSRLTIHTSLLGPLSMPFIRDAKPRVVKLLGGSGTGSPWDQAAAIKAASPGTLIVGRIYFADEPADGDPGTRAQQWWDRCRNVIQAYPAVDYWEGYNEPSVDTVAKMQWLGQFDAARVRILAQNGRKAAIGSFSVGTPEVVRNGQPFGDYWRAFYPAIDEARAKGGVLSLHEYSAPSMRDQYDSGSGEGWTTGRYRKVYRWFLVPDGREIPLVITECGIDGGVIGQGSKGWKSYTSGDGYMEQLKWYDAILKQDSYVLGATIFSLEIPNWQDFDIAPIMPQLTSYVKSGGTAPPAAGNRAQFVTQSVPSTMVAGQKYQVSVTMKNTGSTTWTVAGNYRLGSQNPQDNKVWLGTTHRVNLGSSDSIAPGQEKRFDFTVTAPATPGTYNFQWKMLREGVEWFGDFSTNVPVNVEAPASGNRAQFITQNVPSAMAAGQKYSVSVTMKNSGSTTWTAASNYRLGSQNPQDNKVWLGTTNRVNLGSGDSIAPGQEKRFDFTVTAPSAPGAYHFQWRMLREFVEWFGDFSSDITVQVAPRTVAIPNAGFEQGTTGWSGYRATAAVVGSPVHSGSKALSVTATGPAYTVKNGVSCSGGFNTAPFVAVAGSTRYTVSVWVRGSATPAEAMIYVQQFSGPSYSEKVKSPTDSFAYDVLARRTVKQSDGWVQLSVPFTTAAGTRYLSISLNGNTAGIPVIFDDVTLVAG